MRCPSRLFLLLIVPGLFCLAGFVLCPINNASASTAHKLEKGKGWRRRQRRRLRPRRRQRQRQRRRLRQKPGQRLMQWQLLKRRPKSPARSACRAGCEDDDNEDAEVDDNDVGDNDEDDNDNAKDDNDVDNARRLYR